MIRTRNHKKPPPSPPLIEFIETVERGVGRWQAEGLSSAQALNQAWACAILDLEAAGTLPKGYLHCRLHDLETPA
jgi:hypothetical protein